MKKLVLTLLLLATSACTTYVYECKGPHGDKHDGARGPEKAEHTHPASPPPPAPHPAPAGKPAPHGKAMAKDWDPNAAWSSTNHPPEMDGDDIMVPPPAPIAKESRPESKYDRSPVKPGEHLMPPPPAAAAISGEIDPLHFPHFCGPGARKRLVC